MTPLDASMPVPPPSRAERFWGYIPVVGWYIAAVLGGRRRNERNEYVRRVLACRLRETSAAWGIDPSRLHVVTIVSDAIQRNFGWLNSHYLPEDRMEFLMWQRDAWSGEPVLCVLEFERRLKFKLRAGPRSFGN